MKKIALLTTLVLIAFTTIAQQKYAVLICGEEPEEEGYYVANTGSGWADPGDTIRNEFWNDTYLMWEMLVFEKGFDDDNVFVLYYDGDDYYTDGLAPRYNADESHPTYYPITDYSATKTNAENVFNGLAYGTGGFPLVTQDDFLFVWTFGHGQFCGEIEYNPCLALYSYALTDIELAALVNPIPAHKKVYWMQNCFGGLFADNLAATNAIFHSAGTDESGTIEEQTAAQHHWMPGHATYISTMKMKPGIIRLIYLQDCQKK